jgi:hypothetical protein
VRQRLLASGARGDEHGNAGHDDGDGGHHQGGGPDRHDLGQRCEAAISPKIAATSARTPATTHAADVTIAALARRLR